MDFCHYFLIIILMFTFFSGSKEGSTDNFIISWSRSSSDWSQNFEKRLQTFLRKSLLMVPNLLVGTEYKVLVLVLNFFTGH